MAKYIIEGGIPLRGHVQLLGAKNVGFKLIIAALLADSPTILENVPRTRDVAIVKQIIEELGGKVDFVGAHTVRVDPRTLSDFNIASHHGEKSRAPTLFIGPLIVRFGKAAIPAPGGDQIGIRPIDRHIKGLQTLGLKVRQNELGWEVFGAAAGGSYRFEKNSHTGTESLVLASVGGRGKTTIENAASEPEVDDLINFLNKMGAKIRRIASRTIEIAGVDKLHGVEYKIMPDRNEAVTFAVAALVTGGEIEINGAKGEHLSSFAKALQESGASFEFSADTLRVWNNEGKNLKSTAIVTAPHPGFMTDWQPLWTTAMTQAEGVSTIHETVFENRFAYVSYLRQMGAKIDFFSPKVSDPHRFYNFNWDESATGEPHAIKISGPTRLQGTNLPVSDIRAGATLVLAALAARGISVLENIEHIERGYENLEEKLESLGAKIKKVG